MLCCGWVGVVTMQRSSINDMKSLIKCTGYNFLKYKWTSVNKGVMRKLIKRFIQWRWVKHVQRSLKLIDYFYPIFREKVMIVHLLAQYQRTQCLVVELRFKHLTHYAKVKRNKTKAKNLSLILIMLYHSFLIFRKID